MPSKSKRSKTTALSPIQVPNMDRDKLTATITLPDVKNISTHFHNFCARLRSKQTTVTVKKRNVSIASENEETLNTVRSTIQREVEKIANKQRTAKVLRRNKFPFPIPKPNQWRTPSKFIISRTCGCGRPLNAYRSSNMRPSVYKQCRYWNQIARMWKQSYMGRFRFKPNKFKPVKKYISVLYPRRPINHVSLYRQVKRTPCEYRKLKIIGRRRDGLKEKRVPKTKKKGERKRRWRRNEFTTKGRSNVPSALIWVSVSGFQEEKTLSSKMKNKRKAEERAYWLGDCFFSFSWVRKTFSDHHKLSIRYWDQRLFVYATSIGTKRTRKKDLIFTMSTLNANEAQLVPHGEPNRSIPARKSKSKKPSNTCLNEPASDSPAIVHPDRQVSQDITGIVKKPKNTRRARKVPK